MAAAALRRRAALASVTVLIAVMAGGCIGQPQGSAVRRAQVGIVTHRNLGGGPAAIVGGTLRIDAGCVVFETVDGLAIPMWPPGTTAWEVDGVVVITDLAGAVAALEGEEAFFGGGTDYPQSFVREIADAPVPPACDRPATFMLINSLERIARQ